MLTIVIEQRYVLVGAFVVLDESRLPGTRERIDFDQQWLPLQFVCVNAFR